jgi:parallel beta-helix repeat protein
VNIIICNSINVIGEDKNTTVICGEGVTYLIYIDENHIKIRGFTIKNCESVDRLILLSSKAHNTTIIDNNIITDINFSSRTDGIGVYSACNNVISNNSFFYGGLYVHNSSHNSIFNNTVDGKYLVYLENEGDKVIDIDAGQIILNNCDNITIENQEISNISKAIMLWSTNNCTISHNTISNTRYSIYLEETSNYNTISGNLVTNNYKGPQIDNCNNNTVINNKISSNFLYGLIFIGSSSKNIVEGNIIQNNGNGHEIGCGIYLGSYEDRPSYNRIQKNNICNNNYGIRLYRGRFNLIFQNNIVNNSYPGIFVEDSFLNFIIKNNFIENKCKVTFSFDLFFFPLTFWYQNYWDDLSGLGIFYRIYGVRNAFGSGWYPFERDWIQFDWNPAQEPYDIEVL